MSTKSSTNLLELRRETAHDAPTSPSSPGRRHLPALDGIRGLAVFMVFLVHYGGGAKSSNIVLHTIGIAVTAGWSGVTLFFILSGFLISGIIWDSRNSEGWWGRFYMRRTLRIFPLYYASLLLVFIAAVIAGHGHYSLSRIWVYALYLQNVPIHFDPGNLGSPLYVTHFWSLAVEEQFYLFWPLLLTRVRTLDQARKLSLAVFFVSAAFRFVAWYLIPAHDASGASLHRAFHGAYAFTPSRAGELAIGAYLAMCYRDRALWKRLQSMALFAFIAGLAGFLAAGAFAHTLTDECAAGFLVGLPCVTVCLAALVVLALGNGPISRAAQLPALRWLGGISYGFYIFHVLFTPVFEWIAGKLAPHASSNVRLGLNFVVAAGSSLLLSWLSFRFYESRFLIRRSRYQDKILHHA